MARILLIEDDVGIHKVLSYNLKQSHHEVLSAHRGREGLDLARSRHPDLVLLDLMLPDLPGTKICTALRSEKATERLPIIMLTARGDEIDRVLGLELGADDYVVKPFSVRELLLRVEALLKRSQPALEVQPVVEFGDLKIDRAAHRVWVSDRSVSLTALELKLLCTLYDRRRSVSTREVLLDEVWGSDSDITARAVDTHVQRLREKLGTAAAYVETVRGIGYRFVESTR